VDPVAGETAADNRYVTIDGADLLPDLALGRLPVNTLVEAEVVVGKIVQAETAPAPGAWAGRVVFVSDAKDTAGDFPADSQWLADTYVAWPWIGQQITTTTPVAPAQQAVRAAWEAGAGLIVYNGHASIHQWSVQRLFHLDDARALQNAGRWPVVLELTCFTGAFQTPGLDTLDEALVRAPQGGAAAVWGSTGLGVARGHTTLAAGFLGYLQAGPDRRLGAAALAGKLAVAASPQAWLLADLLDTFTLLGDPAQPINLNPGRAVFLPQVRR
jgi:hypothetical protein